MDPCSACIFGNNNPLVELPALALIWFDTVPLGVAVVVSLLDVVDVIDLVLPFVCLRLCFDRGDGELDTIGVAASSALDTILCRLAVWLLREFIAASVVVAAHAVATAVTDNADVDCCEWCCDSTIRMDFCDTINCSLRLVQSSGDSSSIWGNGDVCVS